MLKDLVSGLIAMETSVDKMVEHIHALFVAMPQTPDEAIICRVNSVDPINRPSVDPAECRRTLLDTIQQM